MSQVTSRHADELSRGAQQLAVEISANQQELLLAYLALLIKWNKAYNLTAVRDPDEMVSRHLLDSLSVVPHVAALGDHWLDVGSGGGMPGIPLAILFPDRRFTLLDSNGKKTRFLTQVKLELAGQPRSYPQSGRGRSARAPLRRHHFPRLQLAGGLRQLDPSPGRWRHPLAGDEGRAPQRRAGRTAGRLPP